MYQLNNKPNQVPLIPEGANLAFRRGKDMKDIDYINQVKAITKCCDRVYKDSPKFGLLPADKKIHLSNY